MYEILHMNPDTRWTIVTLSICFLLVSAGFATVVEAFRKKWYAPSMTIEEKIN